MLDALESEQYGTSFGRESGTVILNVMTGVAMIGVYMGKNRHDRHGGKIKGDTATQPT